MAYLIDAPRPLSREQQVEFERFEKKNRIVGVICLTLISAAALYALKELTADIYDCNRISLKLEAANNEVSELSSVVNIAETNLVKVSRQQRRALKRVEEAQARKAGCESHNKTACAKERSAFTKALHEEQRGSYKYKNARQGYINYVSYVKDAKANRRQIKKQLGHCFNIY